MLRISLRNLVLEDIAQDVNLSKFHFHRLFKDQTGVTLLKYINKLRLEHAAHFLIMYPASKQIDVAFECGYSSPAVFTRSFKSYFGISPSQFRKKRLGNRKVVEKKRTFLKLPVTYVSHKTFYIKSSNLLEQNLNALYSKMIIRLSKTSYAYGVYIDAPFHKPHEICRYYAGLEDEVIGFSEEQYSIEEGYYTYITIQGDFRQVGKQIIDFKEQQIDPSPYIISSLIGFEKIKPPIETKDFSYFSAQRTMFIKIKRK